MTRRAQDATVPRTAGPSPILHLHLRLPPIPHNTFDTTWPSVIVVAEGAWGTVLGVLLDHPDAAITLGALYALGAQRAERTRA